MAQALQRRLNSIDVSELVGRRIAKGDKVVMWYISGNRDEDKIDRAATGSLNSKSAFSGRKSCNGTSGSKSRGRRSGCARISFAEFVRCR